MAACTSSPCMLCCQLGIVGVVAWEVKTQNGAGRQVAGVGYASASARPPPPAVLEVCQCINTIYTEGWD